MSILCFIASKCQNTSKRINILYNGSRISRGSSFTSKRFAIQINKEYRQSHNPISNIQKRRFGVSSLIRSSIKANIDANNVLSSPFPNVENYTDTYLHEIVWKNLDRWPEATAMVRIEGVFYVNLSDSCKFLYE